MLLANLERMVHASMAASRGAMPVLVPLGSTIARAQAVQVMQEAAVPEPGGLLTLPNLNWGVVQEDNFIRDTFDRVLMNPRLSRSSHSGVHATSLIGMCPRKYFLSRYFDRHFWETPPSRTIGMIWRMGEAAESIVASNLRSAFGAHNVVTGVVLRDRMSGVMGAPDILLRMFDTQYQILEIKSKSRREFEAIEDVEMDHALQAAMYYRLLSLGHNNFDGAPWGRPKVVYVCREWCEGSPVIEFEIDPDDSWIASEVAGMFETARDVTERIRTAHTEHADLTEEQFRVAARLAPVREACDDLSCRRASECHVSSLCFALEGSLGGAS